jgi:hypothetical protein
MTPKEKAKELFNKMFCSSRSIEVEQAKKCALIAVDEIINSRPAITDSQIEYQKYWQEVKQEIEKL